MVPLLRSPFQRSTTTTRPMTRASHLRRSTTRDLVLQRNPDVVRSIACPDTLFPAGCPMEAVKLSPEAFEILDGFTSPRRVREVVPDADQTVLAALGEWLSRGLLVRTSRPLLPSRRLPAEARLWAGAARSMRRRVRDVTPTRRERLCDLDLVVFDGLFTAGEVRAASRCFEACEYHKTESVESMKEYTHDVHEVHARVPFVDCITTVVEEVFPRARLELYRAYVNRLRFGDVSFEHRDSRTPSVTALYFANTQWNDDWGGETLFYGKRDEATVAVAPRPGRLILFEGQLGHRGGVPSRACRGDRFSAAVKYWLRA
jgi:SM-20-related protein